ncbi:Ctrb1 [Symbiodinium microadriaticum]|nr:Ctrb1 [Symbiodinium microadriaticum]CAE7856671.1 Ctrb1 [Symbiodinium sp. KB8]
MEQRLGAQSVESAGDGSGSSGSESSFFLGSRLPAAWFGDGTDDDSGCSLDAAGKTSEKTEGKNILDLFSESPAASKDEELEHSQEADPAEADPAEAMRLANAFRASTIPEKQMDAIKVVDSPGDAYEVVFCMPGITDGAQGLRAGESGVSFADTAMGSWRTTQISHQTSESREAMWRCLLIWLFGARVRGDGDGDWWVTSGNCKIDSDGCATSPRYPSRYNNNRDCEIEVAPGNTKAIMVAQFSTEARYDFLEVNGIAFSGEIGPENVVPSGVIKWDADYSITDEGWRLCLQEFVGSS